MNYLFEYSDRLNSPYECFEYDSAVLPLPVRPHWHYFFEILFMREGSILVEDDDSTYILEENDMVLFLPQSVHAIYATSECTARYYVLKFDLSQLAPSTPQGGLAFSGIHFNSIFRLARTEQTCNSYFPSASVDTDFILKCFEECIFEYNNQNYGYRIVIQSHINTLLTYVIRQWRSQGFDTDKALSLPANENSIHSITEYIDQHSNEPLKVEALAQLCSMSYSYFARNFRELYGQSCKKYIEFVRLSKAEDLLLCTNQDLNYISQETGFADCSHFIKAFKAKHNMTPRQFCAKRSRSQE